MSLYTPLEEAVIHPSGSGCDGAGTTAGSDKAGQRIDLLSTKWLSLAGSRGAPSGWVPPAVGAAAEDVLATRVSEAADQSSMPCPAQRKAFLRPFVAGQKDVVVGGRDPLVLIFVLKSAAP